MALVLGGPEDEQGRNGSACSWRSAAVTTDGLVLDLWPPESKGGPYSSVGLVARTLSFPGKLEALYQVTAHATQEGAHGATMATLLQHRNRPPSSPRHAAAKLTGSQEPPFQMPCC